MKWIFFAFILITADYFVLNSLDEFRPKNFIVLHASILMLGFLIFSLIHFLKKKQPQYLGLGVMAGLVIKMIFMTALFIVMFKKTGLSDSEVVNFLIIYALYTTLITVYAVSQVKFNN